MTTIEDKMKLFSKIVFEKIQVESDEEVRKIEIDAKEKIDKEKGRLELLQNNALKDAEKKASIKYGEVVSKEKIKKQQEILKLKEELIYKTMNELEERLVHYTDEESYKAFLLSNIDKSVQNLDRGKYYLIITNKDLQKYKTDIDEYIKSLEHMDIFIQTTKYDFIGGVILEEINNKFRIDNSLKTKLNDYREYVGREIMDNLQ